LDANPETDVWQLVCESDVGTEVTS